MSDMAEPGRAFPIDPATYEWSVRAFSVARRALRVNIRLHPGDGHVAAGEIFLFNHFARFETFIPQYLIYLETGALCRSVAGHQFFAAGDPFTEYLIRLGAVPNRHPGLLPFLAAEILRGRKVVMFPEGGMVKDRRVLGEDGQYCVYSRAARARRKHHAGAAVLAVGLEAFKRAVHREHAAGRRRRVEAWAEHLGVEVPALLAAVCRPTTVVPANITFYPIRVGDNLLRRGVELARRGLPRRLIEELLVEGNILLRDTDMDIRLGGPLRPSALASAWERALCQRAARDWDDIGAFFAPGRAPSEGRPGLRPAGWSRHLLGRAVRRRVAEVRDEAARRMYAALTVNLCHLAAAILMRLLEQGRTEVDAAAFHRMLYVAVKRVQAEPEVFLHRSLRNPDAYRGVTDGACPGLRQFVESAAAMGLLEHAGGRYRLLPKLGGEHPIDEARLENLVAVYANEVAPLAPVGRAVDEAMQEAAADEPALARLRFDDARMTHEWNRRYYAKPRFADINRLETATRCGAPFLLAEGARHRLGVVLVHGFLASPAELREFGERLAEAGYPVLGVRLAGHGTSPWDLHGRRWSEWLASVREGYEVLSALAGRVCLVGFSTGGALCLRLAAEHLPGLAGVAAVAVPARFGNRRMRFVPLVHGANRLVGSVSSWQGAPFRPNRTDHPDINYRHIPVRALYELRLAVADMQRRLADVRCPVTLVQGDRDPVVDPRSAEHIYAKLGSPRKRLHWVASTRHGLLHEDVGDTRARVAAFLEELRAERDGAPAQPLIASSENAPA